MRVGLLATLLLGAPLPQRCAAAEWLDQRVSGPFVCRADFSLRGSKGLLDELSQIQDDLVRRLAVGPAGERIELYFFHDQETYARYLQQNLPTVPYRRALYVKGRGPGMVFAYRSGQFEIDVRHECTHALLHASLPEVPLWLDEGLAVYFEMPASQRAFDHPHAASVVSSVRTGAVPRLESLEKKDGLAEMGEQQYRAAWAWVHFLLHGPAEAHDELVRYVAGLRAHQTPSPLSARLKRRLGDANSQLAAHFRDWRR